MPRLFLIPLLLFTHFATAVEAPDPAASAQAVSDLAKWLGDSSEKKEPLDRSNFAKVALTKADAGNARNLLREAHAAKIRRERAAAWARRRSAARQARRNDRRLRPSSFVMPCACLACCVIAC